ARYNNEMTSLAHNSDKEFAKIGFMQKIRFYLQDNEIFQFFSKNITKSYTREEAFTHIILASLILISLGFHFLNKAFFHFWAIPIPWLVMFGFFILLLIWFVI